jgi:hypothetical protein
MTPAITTSAASSQIARERALRRSDDGVVVVVGTTVVVVGAAVVVVVGTADARTDEATLAAAQPGVGVAVNTGGFRGASGRPKSWVAMALAIAVSPATFGWRWSGLKYGAKGAFGLQSPL